MPYGNNFLFIINAVTLRRELTIFNRVVILLLLYSGIWIYVDNRIGIISDLFHSNAKNHVLSLNLYIVASIILMPLYVRRCYFWWCRVEPVIMASRLFMVWGLVGAILAWLGWDLSNQDLLKGWAENLGTEEVWELASFVAVSKAANNRNPTTEEILKDNPPLKIYQDVTKPSKKREVLRFVKGKSGVFCIMNNKTKDKYVHGSPELDKEIGELFKKTELKARADAFKTKKTPQNIYSKLSAKDWDGYSLYILEFVDKAQLRDRVCYYHDKLKPVEGPVRMEWSEETGEYVAICRIKDPERFYAGHPRFASRVQHIAVITTPKVKVDHKAVKIYYSMSEAQAKRRAERENWHKSGVYRWLNWSTGRSYIGSSKDLTDRFKLYFNTKSLEEQNTNLVKAIKRQGLEKFNLEILEYCHPKVLLERERYFIELYQPEFNRLKPNKPADVKGVNQKPQAVEHQSVIEENEALSPNKNSIPEQVSKAVETAPAKVVETAPAESLVNTDEKIVPGQPGLSQPGAANPTDLELPATLETAKEGSQPIVSKNLALNKQNDLEGMEVDYSEARAYKESKSFTGLSREEVPSIPIEEEEYPTAVNDEEEYPTAVNFADEWPIESYREEGRITDSNCERGLTTNSTCEQEGKLGESSEQTGPISQASTLAEKPAKSKKTWTLSSATKAKMSEIQSKRVKDPRPGQSIRVHDLISGESVTYTSFREAAAALKMSVGIISRRIKLDVKKPYKGRYTFSIFSGPD